MPWISICTTSVIFTLALEPGDHPAPGPCVLKGNTAGVYPGLRDGMADHREAGDGHIVSDQQMAANRSGAADLAPFADHRAAGNAGTTGDGRVGAQAHVVTDLD